jgi:hypothetical protein
MRRVCFLTAVSLLGVTASSPRSREDAPPPGAPFRFRDVTAESGLGPYVRGALNHAVAWGDFDNDGRLDLYWSAYFAEGTKRWPFLCRGLGVKDGLPRFRVPPVPAFDLAQMKKNAPSAEGVGMVYYVNGPAVDYDGDGKLDLFGGAEVRPRGG